jgi:hypothetical protein
MDYVLTLADAVIEAAGGAEHQEEGFVFARGSASADRLNFRGRVRITAHEGAMDVLLADPSLIFEGNDAWLECTTKDGRLRVVRLLDCPALETLAAGGGEISDIALTMDGSAWLGDVYRPWKRMDPIVIR